MKINAVYLWVFSIEKPEKFRSEGPFEVTIEDIDYLSSNYDVMIKDNKEIGKYIILDEKNMKFCRR